MAGTLSRRQAEREFYYRALGGNFPQKRTEQLARETFIKLLAQYGALPGRAQQMPLEQLESIWLKQFILTSGGSVPTGTGMHPVGYKSELWLIALKLTPQAGQATKSMNTNRITFYLNN